MPDDINKFVTKIEVPGAKEAVRDLDAVDEAQKRVAKSAEDVSNATRKGKRSQGKSAKKQQADTKKQVDAQNDVTKATKETAREIQKVSKSIGGNSELARSIIRLAAAIHLVDRGIGIVNKSLDKGIQTGIARSLTGMGAKEIGGWEIALSKYGGNITTATSAMANIQRNIALALSGNDPFDMNVYRYMGSAATIRPGMSHMDFLRQIAPRMQALSMPEALIAGQGMGLTPDLIQMLHDLGAGFEAELRKRMSETSRTDASVEEARQNAWKREKMRQDIDQMWLELGNKLLNFLPESSTALGYLGQSYEVLKEILTAVAVLKVLKWLAPAAGGAGVLGKTLKFLSNPWVAIPAVVGGGFVTSTGSGMSYVRLRAEQIARENGFAPPLDRDSWDEQIQYDDNGRPILYSPDMRDSGSNRRSKNSGKDEKDHNFGAFNLNTPFNYLTENAAMEAGRVAGGAGAPMIANNLSLGGITINAPGGDPEAIREGVVEGGDIVLEELYHLQQQNAGIFAG